MLKLGTVIPYLKKIKNPKEGQKRFESRDVPLSSADISIFYPKLPYFATLKNIDVDCILILLTFIESVKIV